VGLTITHVRLKDFRSYETLSLDPDPSFTILVGPNAVGKTNVIEAIQVLTTGQSFRKPAWADVVRWGADGATAELTAEGEGRSTSLAVEVSREGRRTFRVNGKAKRGASSVVGILPSVVFAPDDLRLVKDSAERRRSALDFLGDQLSKAYLAARLDFERALRQRNAVLKTQDGASADLEAWTHILAEKGAPLTEHRRRLFARIEAAMSETYGLIAGREGLSATYVPSWEREGFSADEGESARDVMDRALRGKQATEIARGVSLIGPHRDEVVFFLDGKDARAFASQGQQRTIALAWKLAEVRVAAEVSGQQPVLLLDDVMSELDSSRRDALAALVGNTTQTIVTTTNLGYFGKEMIRNAKVVELA
jgi:DNA replication and repair protein RecF